ncbi:MAG: IS4 family transposase [Terrimonas sp.]|nr:IS4 family transposase [Terrimonas sp.]OJY93827.1 MAG: hypothetical protein BGP13_00780 [Sphingobacteriales bacterium 40-81]
MNKSTFFTGQPIFTQLLRFIPRNVVSRIALDNKSDRYCKRFNTYEHLVTMLYAILNNCHSLREVITGMLAAEQRLSHLAVRYHPRRSTLSDANNRRSAKVFEDIYYTLFNRYAGFLSDSRRGIYIFDSTTISLFQEILRTGGMAPANGKRKGGIKVHTLLRSDQDVPCMIRFSQAAASDSPFLKHVHLPAGSIILFDRGYHDLSGFQQLTDSKVTWITRRRQPFKITVLHDIAVKSSQKDIISDQKVSVGLKAGHIVQARLITYRNSLSGECFQFLTNNFRMLPSTIADLYRKRWQIEILFKRMKQNYPLRYFLGDTANAIQIQIWCALIADFIINLIKKTIAHKWSFSNLCAMVRLHLMTYINLKVFLKAPEKALLKMITHHKSDNFNLLLFKT